MADAQPLAVVTASDLASLVGRDPGVLDLPYNWEVPRVDVWVNEGRRR